MTLSHISRWYLWLCQTFSVKCRLGKRQPHCRSTFFLWIWHACARYTAPQLCLVIYFALSRIRGSIFFFSIERDADVKRFSISPCSDAQMCQHFQARCRGGNHWTVLHLQCVCMWEREERKTHSLSVYASSICVPVLVYVLFSHSLNFSVWNATPADVSCKLQPPASLSFRRDHWNKAIKVALYMGAKTWVCLLAHEYVCEWLSIVLKPIL